MEKQKDIPLPFGKYKGVLICDIPDSYLKWVSGEAWFKQKKDLAEQVAIELDYRRRMNIKVD